MDLKIIYEDSDILVVDKPAGVVVFDEIENDGEPRRTIIQILLEKYPELKNVGEAPRYGIAHRLDKDTSGLLLVAKSSEVLIFLQKKFKNREIEKKYTALVTGAVTGDSGTIHTLMGRSNSDPRKQTAHSLGYTGKTGLREAISEYKVLQRFADPSTSLRASYTLMEVLIKTGRKHQIRCQMAYLKHPVAGDKVYGFKDSPKPEGLERQFLHASDIKMTLPSGKEKEFHSDLPEELQKIINELT